MFEMSDRESYQVTGDRGKRRRQLGGKDLEKAAGGSMREKAWYRQSVGKLAPRFREGPEPTAGRCSWGTHS